MKKLLIILFFMITAIQAQIVENLGIAWLYKTTAYEDSVQFNTDSCYYYLLGTAAADTFISRTIHNRPASGDIHVTGRLTNVSGSVSSKIYVGLYRGGGYPDYTGIEWKELKAFTASGNFQYSLKGQNWSDDQPTGKFWIKIRETGAQQNKYIVWFHRFHK